MTDNPLLPGLLSRIAEAAGDEAAMLVAKEFGGRRFYVPLAASLTAGHRLVELVGMSRARAICIEFGKGEIIVPRGPYSSIAETRRRVVEMLAERKSHATIATATGLHIRTVEKIASRFRDSDPAQMPLF